MDYLFVFMVWLTYSTLCAMLTRIIVLLFGKDCNERDHFIHWFLLPLIWIFWILSSLYILIFRKKKKEKITYNAILILKRTVGDWSI